MKLLTQQTQKSKVNPNNINILNISHFISESLHGGSALTPGLTDHEQMTQPALRPDTNTDGQT